MIRKSTYIQQNLRTSYSPSAFPLAKLFNLIMKLSTTLTSVLRMTIEFVAVIYIFVQLGYEDRRHKKDVRIKHEKQHVIELGQWSSYHRKHC